MSDNKFTNITKDISTQLAKMRKEMPEVMAGFSAAASHGEPKARASSPW